MTIVGVGTVVSRETEARLAAFEVEFLKWAKYRNVPAMLHEEIF